MGRTKKRISILMVVVMAIFAGVWIGQFSDPSYATENTTEFAGGDGSVGNPYKVETTTQLNNIRYYSGYSNKYFVLTQDIIFTDADFGTDGAFYNAGAGWVPIPSFYGNIDGAGHKIQGLKIDITSDYTVRAGLIGSLYGSIQNVRAEDFNLAVNAGGSYIGSLAGYQYSGSISGCTNTGIIAQNAGNQSGIYVGGLVGYIKGGTVSGCYNTGTIQAKDGAIGGIAGTVASGCTVEDCYNAGILNNGGSVGGIVSWVQTGGLVKNCYNIGRMDSVGNMQGGICYNTTGTLTNCYYLSDQWGKSNGTPLTLDQMSSVDNFSGFDFTNIWEMVPDTGYPLPLLRQLGVHERQENCTEFAGGVGDAASPYMIENKEQLNNVRNHPQAYYILQNDITFEPTDFEEGGAYYNNGYGWKGICGSNNAFYGSFDGNGKVISGIRIHADLSSLSTNSQYYYPGLFGSINGEVKNLGLKEMDIWVKSENAYVGGLASGATIKSTISNCYSEGVFRAESGFARSMYVGGLLGSSGGIVQNCYSVGTVYSDGTAGGLIGGATGSAISDCYSASAVMSMDSDGYAGGVVGSATDSAIKNCLFTGNAFNNYLTASSQNYGKIVGYANSGTSVSQSYYLNSGYSSVKGTPLSKDQIKLQSSYEGFDFANVWSLDANSDYPIPYLKALGLHSREINDTEFAGGVGDAASPYIIKNKEQLSNVRNHLGAYYTLDSDIAFNDSDFQTAGAYYNEGEGWDPIASHYLTCFYGAFDGNGHSIQGMRINAYADPDDSHRVAGLFGYFAGDLSNLEVAEGNIFIDGYGSPCYAGGFAGYMRGGRISNCLNSSAVTSNSSSVVGGIAGTGCNFTNCHNTADIGYGQDEPGYAGGICGLGSAIVKCSNTGFIRGTNAGGLAGKAFGIIDTSYNTAMVNGFMYAGGLAGLGSETIISNAYNLGDVAGNYAGGLAGALLIKGNVSNCYSLGAVTSGYAPVTGLFGDIQNVTLTQSNNYFLSGYGTTPYTGTPKSLEEMESPDAYAGFDFDGVWIWEPLVNRAFLRDNRQPVFTISYDSLGSVMPASYITHYISGGKLLLPVVTGLPENNYFRGWCEQSDLSDEPNLYIQAGETGNKIFYAKWTTKQYKIIFDANGGLGGPMDSITVTNGSTISLPVNLYTKAGWKYAGWTSNADGTGTFYGNGDSVADLANVDNAMVTLYAKWTPNTYTIQFNGNGGTGTMSNLAMTYDTTKTLPTNTFKKTGYLFAGWSTSPTGSVSWKENGTAKNLTTQDQTTVALYAIWTPIKYTLAVDPNQGIGTKYAVAAVYDRPWTIPARTFTRTGYAFLGWATSSTGSAVYKDNATVMNLTATNGATVTLYAKWGAPITSAASYNYNSIKVSWAAADGASSYKIYRATSATGTYALVHTSASTTRSWIDTGRTTGKNYYYKVYPVAGGTTYKFSTYKYAKAVPATPTATLSKYSSTSIKVSWTGVSGATRYQIYRATSATGTYTYQYTTSSMARSWVNTGLTAGKTYYYKVRAYHLEGTTKVYGSFSAVKYLKI